MRAEGHGVEHLRGQIAMRKTESNARVQSQVEGAVVNVYEARLREAKQQSEPPNADDTETEPDAPRKHRPSVAEPASVALTFASKARTIAGFMAPFSTVELCGMSLAKISTAELLDHVFESLSSARGGWLVTANLDFLRRYVRDPASRAIYADADLRVADGMPLVWASQLLGTPLPERVAGSSLLLPLCKRAAKERRSVYLLGGDPKAVPVAAERLLREAPGLVIAGQSCPNVSAEPSERELAAMREALLLARPAMVFVAFGSPKQERVIAALRAALPETWWIGVGISFSFLAGHVKRAPRPLQVLGLEWAHRLAQEPRRLFRRYIIEDLPFAFELFGRVAIARLKGPEA